MKKTIFVIQYLLQFFVALGALSFGGLMIVDPAGVFGLMPPDMLKNSPFHDFLFPGVILFLVNGVGQLTAGILTIKRHPKSGFIGAVFGLGLMIWIFVQVNMIGGRNVIQYSYFFFGVLETSFAFVIERIILVTKKEPSVE